MELYGYWRSTASYRVRIALALKGLRFENVPVHLLRDGGEQFSPQYRTINPQGRVPTLKLDDGTVLVQSLAIVEYLEEAYPDPPLLPRDPLQRARTRAIAAIVACDIHPLHNLGPLARLRITLGVPEIEVEAWIRHWIGEGLATIEMLIGDAGFAFGPAPGLADVHLVPQLYAAHRFGVDLTSFARIRRIEALSADHHAFQTARPDRQPDAPASRTPAIEDLHVRPSA